MRFLPVVVLAIPLALAQAPQSAYPLESIAILGNQAIPTERIQAASGLKLGQRVTRDDFNAARDRLMATGAFTGVGFRYAGNAANTGYEATFEVREVSPLYRYRFEDLPAPDADLRAALRRQEPVFDDAISAAPQVLNRYSAALAAIVNLPVIGDVNADLPGDAMIVFRPMGEPRVVSQVDFQGHKAIAIQDLWRFVNQTAIGTPYTETRFRRILDATLRPPYEERGHLRLSFPKIETRRSSKNEGLDVTVTLDEGPVYKLGAVTYAGVDPDQQERFHTLGAWPKDDVANVTAVEEGAARIRKDFRQNGYLRVASETSRTLDDASSIAGFLISIQAGPRFSMGKLSINGLDIVSEPVIRKLWGLNEGAIYRESYPDDFVARIQAEGYFDNLERIGVEAFPHDDTRSVDVVLTFVGGRVTTSDERRRRR